MDTPDALFSIDVSQIRFFYLSLFCESFVVKKQTEEEKKGKKSSFQMWIVYNATLSLRSSLLQHFK